MLPGLLQFALGAVAYVSHGDEQLQWGVFFFSFSGLGPQRVAHYLYTAHLLLSRSCLFLVAVVVLDGLDS